MVAVTARGGEPVDRQAAAGPGDDHRDGGRRLAERERRTGGRDESRRAGAGEMVGAAGGGRLAPLEPQGRRHSGNGSSAAIFAAMLRGLSSVSSTPAISAAWRQGWQWAR